MKQSDCLDDELGTSNDLWVLLYEARKISRDHEYFGPKLHDMISTCVGIVESYQDELQALMDPLM